jgi:hypothetical protein
VPVPLRAIVVVLLVEELLVMVNCPVVVPAVVGSNCTSIVSDWQEVSVTGNVTPETVKPVPVSAAAVIVTEPVPVSVIVTDWVDVVFTATSPKVSLVTLGLSIDIPVEAVAFNCRA